MVGMEAFPALMERPAEYGIIQPEIRPLNLNSEVEARLLRYRSQ
jgi:hypothetical protein